MTEAPDCAACRTERDADRITLPAAWHTCWHATESAISGLADQAEAAMTGEPAPSPAAPALARAAATLALIAAKPDVALAGWGVAPDVVAHLAAPATPAVMAAVAAAVRAAHQTFTGAAAATTADWIAAAAALYAAADAAHRRVDRSAPAAP